MIEIDFPPFVPRRFLGRGNLQTLLGVFLSPAREPDDTIQHVIPTTQGDQLVVHENRPVESRSNGRHVVLLHGLAGCHRSTYMIRTSRRLTEAGFRVWRLDARGSGAGVALARYHHHAGRTDDLQAALRLVNDKDGSARISLVGFSLGGNVVLRWLGREALTDSCNVDSAVAVAPPADLQACSRNMKIGLARGYDLYFAKILHRHVLNRRVLRPDMVNFPFDRVPESLHEFDRQFTAPAGGFTSIDDYYEKCSSAPTLSDIVTPTLIVVDESDPVVPSDILADQQLSEATRVLRTHGGGHLGYWAAGGLDPDRHWLDWRIVQAIQSIDNRS